MGLDNATIKMHRDKAGQWVRSTPDPDFPDISAMDRSEWAQAFTAYSEASKAVEPDHFIEGVEMDAAFAHLPEPFNGGGYLRGKGWASTVQQASGLSLYAELLTPDDCAKIAQALRDFDQQTRVESQTYQGLIAYFQTCADRGYGIVSWY